MKAWKFEAEELFFREHLSFIEISARLGVSRQSISNHLKALPQYEEHLGVIREDRKEQYVERNKKNKAQWENENREERNQAKRDRREAENIEVHILRRQQQQAAAELSERELPSMLSQLDYFGSAYKQNPKSGAYIRQSHTKDGAAVPTSLPKRVQKTV